MPKILCRISSENGLLFFLFMPPSPALIASAPNRRKPLIILRKSVSAVGCGIVLSSLSFPLRAEPDSSPATLHAVAQYYHAAGATQNFILVFSSDEGLYTGDDRLTDYSLAAIRQRQTYVKDLLARVQKMPAQTWRGEDNVDWLLFRAQLEAVAFDDRVLKFYESNPQLYIDECSNGIFTLLKKDYAKPEQRSAAAVARLRQMPCSCGSQMRPGET